MEYTYLGEKAGSVKKIPIIMWENDSGSIFLVGEKYFKATLGVHDADPVYSLIESGEINDPLTAKLAYYDIYKNDHLGEIMESCYECYDASFKQFLFNTKKGMQTAAIFLNSTFKILEIVNVFTDRDVSKMTEDTSIEIDYDCNPDWIGDYYD